MNCSLYLRILPLKPVVGAWLRPHLGSSIAGGLKLWLKVMHLAAIFHALKLSLANSPCWRSGEYLVKSENNDEFGQPSIDLILLGKHFPEPLEGWWPSVSIQF